MKPTQPQIAYQGVPGAYSNITAKIYFGSNSQNHPCSTFDQIFKWEYLFYLDFEVFPQQTQTFSLTEEIKTHYSKLRLIGFYPTGSTHSS